MTYSDTALLKRDPFLIEPPAQNYRSIWSDMQEVYAALKDVIRDFTQSGVSHVVLNRGPYGSGKTHAAFYFGDEKRLQKLVEFKSVIRTIYLRTPKDYGTAIDEFYEGILDHLSLQRVRIALAATRESMSTEAFKAYLARQTTNQDIATALQHLSDEQVDLLVLSRYLRAQRMTPKELRELRLVRGLRSGSAQERTVLLKVMLRAVMGGCVEEDPEGRVLIWVDETEDLNFYPDRQRRLLTSLWRDMVDSLPTGLALFLNYTPRQGSRGDVAAVFGEPLVSRVTHMIEFRELSSADASKYVIDILNAPPVRSGSQGGVGVLPSYPFEASAIEEVVSKFKGWTPRKLNLVFGRLLRSALAEKDVLKPDHSRLIDTEFVKRKLSDLEEVMRVDQELTG